MEHEQATELLSEYLEGELDPDRVQSLEEHLESCEECSQTLAMLSQALQVVSAMPRARAPEHFARRVQIRARRAGLVRSRRQNLMGRMTAPFSSVLTTWGLLLSVGLLLVVVMIAQQQIELMMMPAPAPVVELDNPDQLVQVKALAGRLGIRIEPKADPKDPLELCLEPEQWSPFNQAMRAAGMAAGLPAEPPRKGKDGLIHLQFSAPAPQAPSAPSAQPGAPESAPRD